MIRFASLPVSQAHCVFSLVVALSGAVFLSVPPAHARQGGVGPSDIDPGGISETQRRCGTATGSTHGWEGSTPSGTNTGNGNKLTTIPLLGWKARGGLPVSLSLYNNSQSDTVSELGAKWTHSFDIYVVFDPTTQAATIHWGNALAYPFAKTVNGYAAPSGIYDTLASTGTASAPTSFTLTTKAGVKYQTL